MTGIPFWIPAASTQDGASYKRIMAVISKSSEERIQVLVADADRLNCELLVEALERSGQFHASGAVNSAEVLTALNGAEPEVALVSLAFLGEAERVFKLLRELKAAYPQIRVVVLMDVAEKQAVVESFRAGAKGVFCRSDAFPALCKCIQRVWEGQIWATSAEMAYALQALTETHPVRVEQNDEAIPLSQREGQVVRLVADGLSNREISQHLQLSEHTIKNYLSRIFEKLGISSRVELVLLALSYRNRPAGLGIEDGPTEALVRRVKSRRRASSESAGVSAVEANGGV